MFESSLALHPSRWRRYLLLLPLLLALSLALLLPSSGLWLWCYLLLLAVFAGLWWQQWSVQHRPQSLLIGEQGELRWLPGDTPAGQLQADSLVLEWAIRLHWRTAPSRSFPKGELLQRWIFADQCNDDDFRALARSIRQCQLRLRQRPGT
ncbi:MAG: hypothetical protein LAT66_00890 [Alkalimonas sp.]|nr:hypothetical protein [Alkalimonas sp.]